MSRSAAAFTVGLVQMRCSNDPEDNLRRATEGVREAAGRGAQVVCLPELFRTQYFCQTENADNFDLAEAVPGPTTEALAAVARATGAVVVGSVFERRTAGVYHNTAVVIDADGSLVGVYRKMHIPDDPLFYEKYYFTPGDLGFRTFQTKFARVGTLVCWDQWYPEGARITALKGAETLFFPTAIGWHPSEKIEFGERQYDAWQTIQRAHAIANGVFVCAVNRVGHEHGDVLHNGVMMEGPGDHSSASGLEFWGGSFIADPFGRVIARASHDKEEILYADLDSTEVEVTRQHWAFLRDRRIDAYGGITSRFLD